MSRSGELWQAEVEAVCERYAAACAHGADPEATRAEADARLRRLGFDPHEAGEMLDAAWEAP